MKNEAQKDAEVRVHAQHGKGRLGHGSVRQIRHNQIQPESSLRQPVSTFNNVSFAAVTVLCLAVGIRVFPGSAQSRP